jgi:hypothetical protein
MEFKVKVKVKRVFRVCSSNGLRDGGVSATLIFQDSLCFIILAFCYSQQSKPRLIFRGQNGGESIFKKAGCVPHLSFT